MGGPDPNLVHVDQRRGLQEAMLGESFADEERKDPVERSASAALVVDLGRARTNRVWVRHDFP